MENEKVRILIVDDHPIVCRGLAELIENEADLAVCGEAGDIIEALKQVGEAQPHLAVIDLSLRNCSGIELIKQLKARHPGVKMLVTSMHDETVYAERALRAGAMGYINKEEATVSIIEAIRQVLRGKVYLSRRMTDTLLQQVARGEPPNRSLVDHLTDRELEVFELIGQGLTTRQIASSLHLSIKTIETHRDGIKTKLNLTTGPQLARRAVEWVLSNS